MKRVFIFVLVLSLAVLVIVIDLSTLRCARLGDTSEFHRHPSQHRHDPVQHPFYRSIILSLDAFGPHQSLWSSPKHPELRHTPELNRERCR